MSDPLRKVAIASPAWHCRSPGERVFGRALNTLDDFHTLGSRMRRT